MCALPFAGMTGPCAQTHPVYKGNPAPCDGVLIPAAWAVSALQCVSADLPACRGGHDLLNKLNDACNKSLIELSNTCEKAFRKYENLALKAAGISRPFYESPILWFVVGVLGTGSAFYLITK